MPAEPSFKYSAYGLLLEINWPVPTLLPSTQTRCADVRIRLRGENAIAERAIDSTVLYQSPGRVPDGTPYFTVARLHVETTTYIECRHVGESGQASFTIDTAGEHIDVSWTRGMLVDDLIAYLTGPVFGCLLRLRATACLHASVISIDDKAIALIGTKGAGKSTLTAAFAYDGNPVLADDIAALKDEGDHLTVQPGYPRLRLWPDAVERLTHRSADDLPLVISSMDKRLQTLTEDPTATRWRFQSTPLPLSAVYLLDSRRTRAPPVIRKQLQSDCAAMFALMSNTYANYVCDTELRRHEMKILARLVRNAPVVSIRPQWGFAGVRRLRDVIRQHAMQTSTLRHAGIGSSDHLADG
jgi:hypothetical protein